VSAHRPFTRFALLVAGVLALGACADFSALDSTDGRRYLAAYRSFSSCEDLENWTRDALSRRVTAWGLGGGWVRPMPVVGRAESDVANGAAGASVSTGTNVQEAGIDEGDIAENDGRYVYLALGERLRVIDTVELSVLDETSLPVGDHQMILDSSGVGEGTLVVLTSLWSGAQPETVMHRYSLAEGEVSLLGVDHLEGSLLAVRSIEGHVHAVLRHELAGRLEFVAPTSGDPESEQKALEENRRIAAKLVAADVLPRSFQVAPDGTRGPLQQALPCEAVGTPQQYSGLGLTWVTSLDLRAPSEAAQASAGVVADAEHIYASASSIWLATMRQEPPTGDVAPIRPLPAITALHRFDLAAGGATYRASGEVAGRVISPYSLSEHAGLLRVATTTDDTGFGEESQSGIRVFETTADRLLQIGEVDGLGKGETIQGVRFAGDLAFVVTFRQIDPLYTVDISDPRAPQVRGELKIPGFSTWLLPLGDGRLLTFGRSGTDDGTLTGVQWSLFDVTDLDDPRLESTLGAGGNSEAIWDPKAIAFEPATGTLLTPGESWETVVGTVPPPPESILPSDPAREPASAVDGSSTATLVGGNYFVNVGQLAGEVLSDLGKVPLPTNGRRPMLVGGRIVSVNADGSVTIAEYQDLTVVVTIS
jgi:hypothetical protein